MPFDVALRVTELSKTSVTLTSLFVLTNTYDQIGRCTPVNISSVKFVILFYFFPKSSSRWFNLSMCTMGKIFILCRVQGW